MLRSVRALGKEEKQRSKDVLAIVIKSSLAKEQKGRFKLMENFKAANVKPNYA